jgi:hypothetical protein
MRLVFVLAIACGGAPTPAPDPEPPPIVRQIKSAHELAAPVAVARYEVTGGAIAIDGRTIPVTGTGPVDKIAHGFARVPPDLRPLLQTLAISPVPSPNDDYFRRKYKLPVQAGMSTGIHGDITIYPYGIEELRDEDFFVKNFMHELGHAWSRPAWKADPASEKAWRDAVASDPDPPSEYARASFASSGALDEDVAEATALYFLERGTPAFARYRARMPARFALLAERFP